MAVIRVTQPEALDDPEIRAFFIRAIVANKIPYPDGTIMELQARFPEAQLGVWAGLDDTGKLVGLCIAQLPTSNFMLAAQVLLAYNEGDPKVTKEVKAAVQEWISSFGLKSLIGCNRSGHPDKVWLRANKDAGTPTFVGSAYEWKWE